MTLMPDLTNGLFNALKLEIDNNSSSDYCLNQPAQSSKCEFEAGRFNRFGSITISASHIVSSEWASCAQGIPRQLLLRDSRLKTHFAARQHKVNYTFSQPMACAVECSRSQSRFIIGNENHRNPKINKNRTQFSESGNLEGLNTI
jgi:hypothetical protein